MLQNQVLIRAVDIPPTPSTAEVLMHQNQVFRVHICTSPNTTGITTLLAGIMVNRMQGFNKRIAEKNVRSQKQGTTKMLQPSGDACC